jgi:glycosyltransferase involved in cell wall biosynthesis
MHKVSVIIPTYNSEKTLDRTIRSVLNQKGLGLRFDLELLICDDCSTDKTMEVVKKFLCYHHLRILRNKVNTGGPNGGRNKGIKAATGDLLAFLDHDDEWLPEKTLHQMMMLDKYDQDFAYSTQINEDKNGNRWAKGKNLVSTVQPDSTIHKDLVTWTNRNAGANMGSVMLKNENVPLFKHPWVEYEWLVETTKDRRCIRTIPLMIRHVEGGNLSMKEEYRLAEYELLQKILTPNGMKMKTGSFARFYYKIGKYKESRYFLTRAKPTVKNIAYYLTSFWPKLARWIVRKFNVWG